CEAPSSANPSKRVRCGSAQTTARSVGTVAGMLVGGRVCTPSRGIGRAELESVLASLVHAAGAASELLMTLRDTFSGLLASTSRASGSKGRFPALTSETTFDGHHLAWAPHG